MFIVVCMGKILQKNVYVKTLYGMFFFTQVIVLFSWPFYTPMMITMYKIFTSCYLFFYSEIQEIYTLPSQTDLSPVSGYLSFHEALRQQTIVVTATQDSEEENNEVFTVVLLTANNGGTLSETDSNARITSKLSMVTKLKKY